MMELQNQGTRTRLSLETQWPWSNFWSPKTRNSRLTLPRWRFGSWISDQEVQLLHPADFGGLGSLGWCCQAVDQWHWEGRNFAGNHRGAETADHEAWRGHLLIEWGSSTANFFWRSGITSFSSESLKKRFPLTKTINIPGCRIAHEGGFADSHLNKSEGSLQEKEQGAWGGLDLAHTRSRTRSKRPISYFPLFSSKCSSFNSSCRNSGSGLRSLRLIMWSSMRIFAFSNRTAKTKQIGSVVCLPFSPFFSLSGMADIPDHNFSQNSSSQSDVATKYKSAYEDKVNPFAAFHEKVFITFSFSFSHQNSHPFCIPGKSPEIQYVVCPWENHGEHGQGPDFTQVREDLCFRLLPCPPHLCALHGLQNVADSRVRPRPCCLGGQ